MQAQKNRTKPSYPDSVRHKNKVKSIMNPKPQSKLLPPTSPEKLGNKRKILSLMLSLIVALTPLVPLLLVSRVVLMLAEKPDIESASFVLSRERVELAFKKLLSPPKTDTSKED